MKKLIILLLIVMVLVSGCTLIQADDSVDIGSEEEATDALINVSSDVGDIESTLEDIDELLE
jgi:hypothetical protein